MQLAAQEELGAVKAVTSHLNPQALREAQEIYKEHGEALRAIARAQYVRTQQWLKEKGIKELWLFRGQGWEQGKVPKDLKSVKWNGKVTKKRVGIQPLSSWTTDWDTAKGFAANDYMAIAAAKVPAKRIFSMPRTGLGCAHESEFVVLGSKDQAMVLTWDRSSRPGNIPNLFEEALKKVPKKETP